MLTNSVELIAVKTALLIKENYGLQYTFVIPVIAIFCSAVWAFLFMPETHGRTLKEIGSIYSEKGNEAMVSSLKLFAFCSRVSLNAMIFSKFCFLNYVFSNSLKKRNSHTFLPYEERKVTWKQCEIFKDWPMHLSLPMIFM